ncbi:hypothetical protein AM593_01559, partial [Mytilus galloprovincialis]
MASISQLTEEEGNFTRFFLLNFKVSPAIARRFFDGVFPPTHLSQIINNSMSAILKLNKSKRINAAQLEILRGIPGTRHDEGKSSKALPTSSMDFDLTMMICLLRNIGGLATPINGWDRLPPPNEILPGADLATLKWYRNQLAHTTDSSIMDNNEFTLKWTQVYHALTSLNNGQRPQQVNEILNYDLDGEQAKLLAKEELKQLTKDYLDCEKEKEQIESDFTNYREENLPKNIKEVNAAFVERWITEDESFCETMGSELVYDKVKECSCIVVASNSGLGKTATIRHIALKFKLKGFEIVPVESPHDIIKYKTNKTQIFLIDDVLEHESNALSKEEKQNILMKHLRRSNLENEIETKEIEIMCEANYAFPLLCKLVSNNDERFRERIIDRVRVELNTNADENIVVFREDELNEDRLRPLYHRLLTELKSGRFSNLLMSQLFKNRNFVNIFGTHLKTSQRIFDEPFSEASSEWQRSIFQSIFQKQSKDEFKDNKDAINRVMEAKRKRSTIMHWIVAFGCYEFFRYTWSVMTPSKRKQILGRDYKSKPLSKSFFPLAVLGGSLNILTRIRYGLNFVRMACFMTRLIIEKERRNIAKEIPNSQVEKKN